MQIRLHGMAPPCVVLLRFAPLHVLCWPDLIRDGGTAELLVQRFPAAARPLPALQG